MEKYSLTIKPLKNNESANYKIFDNETGEIYKERTHLFSEPTEIEKITNKWKQATQKLNKNHFNFISQNPYAKLN